MSLDTAWAVRWLNDTAALMRENREELVDLDRAIGDGDHGENMDRGFTELRKRLEENEPDSIASALKLTAKTLMSTVGGAAGPLYGTAFLRAAKVVNAPALEAADVNALVEAMLDGVQARGKAAPGEKTMVDALAQAARATREAVADGAEPGAVLEAAAAGAHAGAEATKPMRARKGRASYLGERSVGHLDPGAVSTALIFQAALGAVDE